MELEQIRLGSPVEIQLAKRNENELKEIKTSTSVFLTSVFDITKSKDLIINMPTKAGKVISLPLDMDYLVVINTGNGMFQLTGTITKRGRIDGFPVYVIKPLTGLNKVQRREYYRFKCSIDVSCMAISESIALIHSKNLIEQEIASLTDNGYQVVAGTILDISGGGVRFNTKKEFAYDNYAHLSFRLDWPNSTKRMNLIIRKVESTYKKDLDIYEHRAEFIFKEAEDREVIIKYIFDEDRRIRKKDQG